MTENSTIEPAVLNEEEAAQYIGISVHSLHRMRKEPAKYGHPPKRLQLGIRRVGYRKAALDAWLVEHEGP